MKSKKIILLGGSGQMCNQLFNFSAFISNAKENNYDLTCFGFEKYYSFFDTINEKLIHRNIRFNNPNLFNYINKKFYAKLISIIRIIESYFDIKCFGLYEKTGDLNSLLFSSKINNHDRLYISGWPYWDVQNFIKHSDYIRNIFTPRELYLKTSNDFINKQKNISNTLVGVHIRRTDYKQYEKGKYFFSDDQYLQIIESIQKQFVSININPLFIIFSDEKVTINSNKFLITHSHMDAICDLIAMSQCTYLLGPPSTFSMWASFYGVVPHYWIIDINQEVLLEKFSPIIAPNTYQNGITINLENV